MTSAPRRTVVRFAGGLVLALGLAVVALPASVGAQSNTLADARLLARADALVVDAVYASAPVVAGGHVLSTSIASSQAVLDSLGSNGFASAPYPGEFVVGTMPTLNAFIPAPVVPSYPLYVTSSHPGSTPAAEQQAAGYRIHSESGESSTRASASIAVVDGTPSVSSMSATSAVARDESVAVASAESTLHGLSFGPALTIGEVSARATLTARQGQAPTGESSLSLGSVTVGGVEVGLTSDGFEPVGPPLQQSGTSFAEVLGEAGISVEYLPETKSANRIESAGLSISYATDIPGQGPARVTLVLGRVGVHLVEGAGEAGSGDAASDSGSTDRFGDLGTGLDRPPAVSGEPVDALSPSALAAGRPSAPIAAAAGTGVPRRTIAPIQFRPLVTERSGSFYLALAAAASTVPLAAGALGAIAVRRRRPSDETPSLLQSVLQLGTP